MDDEKYIKIPLFRIPDQYRPSHVMDSQGNTKTWDEIYESNPDFEVYVNPNTLQPVTKEMLQDNKVQEQNDQFDRSAAYRKSVKDADEFVRNGYGWNQWGKLGLWQLAGAASAAGSAFLMPELLGAANLGLTYTGVKNFFGPNGYKRTKDLWNRGYYDLALVSGIGDALDITPLPFNIARGANKAYGLTKAGKVRNLGKAMNNASRNSSVTSTVEDLSQHNITRLGELEIDDQVSNYRQLGTGGGSNFITRNKPYAPNYWDEDYVDELLSTLPLKEKMKHPLFLRHAEYPNPMFSRGNLWYGSHRPQTFPDVLVTREPMYVSTQRAKPVIGANPEDLSEIRRIPVDQSSLNLDNTAVYTNKIGTNEYVRLRGESPAKHIFTQRSSKLSKAELEGIPKGQRNNNPTPDYTQNILSMFPNHDISYVHTGTRTPATEPFAEYLQSVGVDVQRLSDSELQQLMRMRQQSIAHYAGEHGIIDTSPWGNHIQMFDNSRNIGNLQFSINKGNNTLDVLGLYKEENVPGGFSRKAYDIGIDYASRGGMRGVVSGNSLHSPEQTYKVWEYYPTRQVVGRTGRHTFNVGRDINKVGGKYSIGDGPIVLLPNPSSFVLPYKHLSFFHPAMIKNGALQAPKWNVDNPFFSKGGKFKK